MHLKILLIAINSKFVHTNLAVRYIRSYCREFDIDIMESTINDPCDRVIRDICKYDPDVAGFSCYIWNIEMVLKICSSLKKIKPDIKILLGGPEVSFDSVELMESNGYIDYIIRGEGELSSLQLFNYLVKHEGEIKNVGNLTYRQEGKVIENYENPLIEDLDKIPFPYDIKHEDFKNRILYYESSRGCPYRCKYCLSSTIDGVRFASIERVKRDLLWFIENDVRLVKFVDRTFNCGRHYKDIIRFLIEHSKNTRFHFEISGSIIDDEGLKLLKSAPDGLFQLEIGVQTTNENALFNIDRRDDFSMLSRKVGIIRESNNMEIHLDLIAGLPGEDYKSFAKSFNDVYSLKPHMLQLGFLKLLKGSSMREEAGRYGIVFCQYPPYEVLKTNWLSFEEIARLKDIEAVVDMYYNSGRFQASVKYMESKFKDQFSMYEKIAEFINEGKGIKRNLGSAEQYRVLYDFCEREKILDSVMKECLMFDYLMQGRNPVVPDFLKNSLNVDKMSLHDFINDRDNMVKYFPHYSEKDVKEITKNIHAAKFSFDVCRFLKTGETDINECTIIFDYGRRDYRGCPTSVTVNL